MKPSWTVNEKLVRASIALVWLYQGLWCKVLAQVPHHLAVVASVPFLNPGAARILLVSLGLVECGLGFWVLTGWQLRAAAIAQTLLLV